MKDRDVEPILPDLNSTLIFSPRDLPKPAQLKKWEKNVHKVKNLMQSYLLAVCKDLQKLIMEYFDDISWLSDISFLLSQIKIPFTAFSLWLQWRLNRHPSLADIDLVVQDFYDLYWEESDISDTAFTLFFQNNKQSTHFTISFQKWRSSVSVYLSHETDDDCLREENELITENDLLTHPDLHKSKNLYLCVSFFRDLLKPLTEVWETRKYPL